MRTIDSLLTYHFTRDEIIGMKKQRIINGCGGEGKNIEKPMRAVIEALPNFNSKKSKQLFRDLQKICYEHDYEFFIKAGFYSSNYRMAKKVFGLLHWVTGLRRILIAGGLFYMLSKYGRKFYS